jgi:hypothetical protein
MAVIRDLIKPPFANYDVVVYFGCALFSLPIIDHYLLKPNGFSFPTYQLGIGIEFADAAVSTLSLLFSVYLLGHIISYASSLLTEKFIETFLGKVSSAIIISTIKETKVKQEIVSAFIYRKFQQSLQVRNRKISFIRIILLLPFIPLFLIILWIGGFDYYKSRISPDTLAKIRHKAVNIGLCEVRLDEPWYKELEHYVINRNPVALSRMYNYLVISGIFRSLSAIFLACIWMELYYLVHFLITGHSHITVLASDIRFGAEKIFVFIALYTIYGFSVSSYMKFQRRYAEEALFAFLLTDWPEWNDRQTSSDYRTASP